jgi:SAM-dependent methyltransferase
VPAETLAPQAYRFKPFAGSPHAWAIREGSSLERGAPLRILDVGAATGYVGTALREARPGGAELTGIETDPVAREALAARYARVHGSLEALPPEERFDLALLLDVIEHTPDPRATLERTARALRSGGHILVSVPNVAHWSMRGLLLLGSFNYTASGILDRTHLRFFTRKTFLATLREAGLVVESEAYAIEPVELLFPWIARVPGWGLLRRLRSGLAWLWPGLLAYQLLARCRVT